MGLYQYITSIDNHDFFNYITVIIGSILFLNRISPGNNTLYGILVGLVIVYYIDDKARNTGQNFLKEMNDMLTGNDLKKTKNFDIDSEMILFIDNIQEYRYYNPAVYRKMIILIDNFLKIVKDMEQGVKHMGEMYQLAEDYKKKILNAYHSFVHKIPNSRATNNKYQNNMKRLEELLNHHLNGIYQYMQYSYGKRGINIDTKILYKNHPRPNDTNINGNYDYFN